MALDPAARYQNVAELQADILAYQNGFATGAEHAGLGKQLVLLVRRHKGMFGTAAAAWLIITALAVWFVLHLRVKERRALAGEQSAIASEGVAKAEAERATKAEAVAVEEKESTRQALAKSALALAEAAYREANGPAMQSALDTVPADLRDANWTYLLEQSDTSIARLPSLGNVIRSVAPHPKLPSVFAVSGEKPTIVVLNVRTGERLLQFDVEMKANAGRALRVAFSADGERIAVGQGGGTDGRGGIAIYRARDGSKILAWESAGVLGLQFSPDDRHLLQLARSGPDGKRSLTSWDATDGRQVWTYINTVQPLLGGFMPDGRQVLAASRYANPVLLNSDNGSEARTLDMDVDAIDSFAIRPDGLAFLWGDLRGNVHCGDIKTGRRLFSKHVHRAAIQEIAFTADGERFVTVALLPDGRQSIVVSSARTGEPLQTSVGGSGKADGIAVHPLSGELLIGGPAIRVWDITGTAPRWSLPLVRADINTASAAFWGSDDLFFGPAKASRTVLLNMLDLSVSWRPDSAITPKASVSADGKIAAMNIGSGKTARALVVRRDANNVLPVAEFEIHGNIRTFELSPTGDRLGIVTNTSGHPPLVLDSYTGAQIATLEWQSASRLNDLRWLKNGTQLVGLGTAIQARGLAKSEERIIVWDAATGKQVRSVVHPTALDCLVVAPDGRSFAAAGADELVHVFDAETLAERRAFRAHDGPITALAWHPARPIVATASDDLTIKLWNLDTGRRLDTLRGPTAAPRVLNFSPSGQRLACASEDRMVRIWEPKLLNNAALDAPAAPDGWEDLLAKLTTDEVKANGNGWTLSGGVLVSPGKDRATVPLAGTYARSSYQVRVTFRKLSPRNFLGVVLPVGDSQVSFLLDLLSTEEYLTGLSMVDGKLSHESPVMLRGRQINDSDAHELEITVRLSARTAQILVTLDNQPLRECSGLSSSLKLVGGWQSPAQPILHLGASTADWVISAVKVKRLEK